MASGVSNKHKVTAIALLMTIGIVFGDIGTSPLYVMNAIINARDNYSSDYIIGAVSCIIWTLTLQTTVKYVLIALRADNKGFIYLPQWGRPLWSPMASLPQQ